MLLTKIIQISFLLVAGVCMAKDSDCENVKNKVQTLPNPSAVERKVVLGELEGLILQGEICAKNMLGRLYYEGVFLKKSVNLAHEIFYDLAQHGYAPAEFNLVYLALKEKREAPESIVSFLHGLMIKYLGDRQWGYISASSRELAGDYIDELRSSAGSSVQLQTLQEQHRKLAAETTFHLAEMVKARTDEIRGQSNAIVGIIALGMAAHTIGQGNIFNRQPIRPLPTFQFNSVLSPRLYTVMPTGAPNVLYAIPHY